jgi:carbonic anhydrase
MDAQLPSLLAANDRYRGEYRPPSRTPRPARGLVILTCMDTRLDLFRALGLTVGEAHLLRNAGGRVTDDIMRSLVVSTHLLGTREIGVIHHTDCGLEGRTDQEIAVLTGADEFEFLCFDDVEESVRHDVEVIRASPHLPSDVTVWGAVYDVDTGAVDLVR